MAVTYNLKGTTNPSFKIGKSGSGTVLAEALQATSGSQLLLSGTTLTWAGDVVFDTNTLFVDATNNRVGIGKTDPATTLDIVGTLNVSSSIVSSTYTATTEFKPNANDGAVLGTSANGFSDIYLADGAVIYLGNDQDTTITHTPDTGITLNNNLTVGGDLTIQGTTTTVDSTTIAVSNSFTFEGATADDFETVLIVEDPTADRTVTIPDATGQIVLRDTTDTLTNKTMTAPVLNAPVFGTGTNSPYFTEVRYNTSNMMKFNQMYTGAATGSYFDPNEYQKVVTITPAGNSENYQIIGRITAQNAGETHIINFNAALRSGDPLPDLSWTVEYSEEYNGSRYIDPQLWTKETTTAGFIFAFKVLSRIYGTVTVDMDVIPRSSSLLTNVSVNSTQNSEQSSVDTGFTARDMTRVLRRQGTVHTLSGNLLPDTTETYDIGSTTLRFNDIFLAGSTVDIGGTKISKDSNGDIDIKDSSDVRKTIKAAAIELFDTDGKKIKIERDATSGKMKTKKYDSSGNEESDQDVIDISEDKTPKLGGDLDANGNDIDMGTNTITDTKVGQWNTAYGWGNHASAGYVSGDIGFPSDLGAVTGSTTDHIGLGPDLGSIATGDTFVGLVKDFGGFSETVRLSGVQTLTNKTITDAASISIANTSTDNSLLITTTENSSTAGPVITLKRNSASPADADYLGQIKFKGENDADQEIVYGKITGKIQDASDGTEDGLIEFANKKAGSNVITARLRSDSLQLLNGTGLTVAGDTTLTGTLNGHTIPGGTGTVALTNSFTHFHSSAQTVTSTQSTDNASGSVDYTFSELSGAIHYVAFLNRTLMRASEYSVSGTTLTVNTGVLATDDQIEVTGISV